MDIPRTFSTSLEQVREERDVKLRRLLRVLSTRIKSGYVQGHNFIIGYLLTITQVESDIFALFIGLMNNEEDTHEGAQTDTHDAHDATPCSTLQYSKYGLVDMYVTNMPRLNALIYIVDRALPLLAPELHSHLMHIGITTSLLYVPGWSLTLFTNRLDAQQVCGLCRL